MTGAARPAGFDHPEHGEQTEKTARPRERAAEEFVDVGQRDGIADLASFVHDEKQHAGRGDGAQADGRVLQFLPSNRDITPVAVEGDIVEPLQDAQFLLRFAQVEGADVESAFLPRMVGEPYHDGIGGRGHIHGESAKPPHLGQAESFVGGDVAWRVPWHENARRILEPHTEQAAGVIDARRVRSACGGESALAQPTARGGEERIGHLVVGKVKKTEEADAVAVGFVVQRVADRGDATNGAAVAQGEEGGEFAAGGQERRSRQEGIDNTSRNRRDELREAT